MRTLKISSIFLIVTLILGSSLFAQGFQPPSEGKAVIYFTHVSKTQNIEYFHQDKYIGIFKGKSYMRVECDPGNQLFWASEENKEFVHCDLKEGGSYIVIGESKMGMWSARVKLTPITANDVKFFEKAKNLIYKEAPVVIPESQITKRNSELVEFVDNIMDHYENEWKDTKDFPVITPDMAIPLEAMK
jgi:hypothetical protein